MRYPIATGQSATLLGVTEPQLSEVIRRGKVRPEPWIVAGRRMWFREHLFQAAEALGVLTDDLRTQIEREAPSIASTAIGLAAEEATHGSK